jgi:hypothetical protein
MRVTGAIFHKCGGDHTKLIDEDIWLSRSVLEV